MEKDIGKIQKNPETEVVVRIDDFGGKKGVTIREFVTSEKYTGFTKAGTRISPENFAKFREIINSINEEDLKGGVEVEKQEKLSPPKVAQKKIEDDDDINEEDLM